MILSLEVIEANVPLTTATSSSLANAATDSENTIVTVDVSPDFSAVSLIVNELTVGAFVSIVKFAVSVELPPYAFPAVSVQLVPNVNTLVASSTSAVLYFLLHQ